MVKCFISHNITAATTISPTEILCKTQSTMGFTVLYCSRKGEAHNPQPRVPAAYQLSAPWQFNLHFLNVKNCGPEMLATCSVLEKILEQRWVYHPGPFTPSPMLISQKKKKKTACQKMGHVFLTGSSRAGVMLHPLCTNTFLQTQKESECSCPLMRGSL